MSDPELRRRLTEAIMGRADYSVHELMDETGTDREFADELWLSLGFALRGDDDARLYSEIDADMLRSLNDLRALDLVDRDTLLAMTRVMGQAMSRLASAQVELFGEELQVLVSHDVDDLVDDEIRAAITEMLVPGVERFVAYTWRRHLLAALDRSLDAAGSHVLIGFVDLVDYTRVTRDLDASALSELVGRFERHVYETVTASGARLRKLLGDGVMFEASDAGIAAGAALALVMRCAEDPHLPGARGGLSLGTILAMEGDVYGETVNRASRLAALARPNTVVADEAASAAIQGLPGFVVKRLGSRPVKGLGKVEVSVIRPAMA